MDEMIKKIGEFEEKIGVKFNQKKYLIEALSHRSYLNERPSLKYQCGLVDGHNERLEHFGDSVLGLIIAEKLYSNYPGREGELTAIRSHFVNGENLAQISSNIGLDNVVFMGMGEYYNELGRKKIIGNALEALIAAIFIDSGYEKAKEFVNKFVLSDLDNVLKNVGRTIFEDNPIGLLQEIAQGAGLPIPQYKPSRIGGHDHNPTFYSEVSINGTIIGIGKAQGKKQLANKNAALNALTSEFIKNLCQ